MPEKIQYTDDFKSLPTSYLLGKEVVAPLVFENGNYIVNQNLVEYKGIAIDAAIITVTSTNIIAINQVPGRDGSVKQYISKGDYQISIEMRVLSPDGKYPQKQVERIIGILELPSAITVTSPFLSLFNITQIVISSHSISQSNYANLQTITVECLSDAPIYLDDYVIR